MDNKENTVTDINNVNAQNPEPAPQQAGGEPAPQQVETEITAKEAFGGMGRWIKKTAKKVWSKTKKPLAVTGGVVAAAGLTLAGMEMAQQRQNAPELPPQPYPQLPPEVEEDPSDEGNGSNNVNITEF